MLISLFAMVIQPFFLVVVMQGLARLMKAPFAISMNEFSVYSSAAPVYLAILVTMFLYTEAGEGIIRNKLICGKKRYEIMFSYCIVNAAVAIFLQIVSVFMIAALGFVCGAAFQVQPQEIIRFTVVSALAGVGISIFYTMLYLCFCTEKFAIALPAGIAVIMRILMVFILDALYNDSGIPKVSGMTLTVYKGIDRYFAFSHLTGALRWENASYLVGNLLLIVISLIVGICVFTKKDMK